MEIEYSTWIERVDRSAPTAIVLQPNIGVVGIPHIISDLIHFGPCISTHPVPVFTAVIGNIYPAVIAVHNMLGVMRIYPHSVMIRMSLAGYGFKCFAPIPGNIRRTRINIHHQVIIRIDRDPAVIERTKVYTFISAFVRDSLPGLSFIIRAVYGSAAAFHYGIYYSRIAAADI